MEKTLQTTSSSPKSLKASPSRRSTVLQTALDTPSQQWSASWLQSVSNLESHSPSNMTFQHQIQRLTTRQSAHLLTVNSVQKKPVLAVAEMPSKHRASVWFTTDEISPLESKPYQLVARDATKFSSCSRTTATPHYKMSTSMMSCLRTSRSPTGTSVAAVATSEQIVK